MNFSKAEEEPEKEIPETEVSETRYMGEGPPSKSKEETEMSEVAYMGEPEESVEHSHKNEYRRAGKSMGRATIPPKHKEPKGKSA